MFGKVDFLCFYPITFELSEMLGKNRLIFLDFNETHKSTKFHANRGSKVQKPIFPRHFEFMDPKILRNEIGR